MPTATWRHLISTSCAFTILAAAITVLTVFSASTVFWKIIKKLLEKIKTDLSNWIISTAYVQIFFYNNSPGILILISVLPTSKKDEIVSSWVSGNRLTSLSWHHSSYIAGHYHKVSCGTHDWRPEIFIFNEFGCL